MNCGGPRLHRSGRKACPHRLDIAPEPSGHRQNHRRSASSLQISSFEDQGGLKFKSAARPISTTLQVFARRGDRGLPARTANREQGGLRPRDAKTGMTDVGVCRLTRASPTALPRGRMTASTCRRSPRLEAGFSQIADRYDVLLCDVWGVIHNGRESFPEACAALARYRAGGGTRDPDLQFAAPLGGRDRATGRAERAARGLDRHRHLRRRHPRAAGGACARTCLEDRSRPRRPALRGDRRRLRRARRRPVHLLHRPLRRRDRDAGRLSRALRGGGGARPGDDLRQPRYRGPAGREADLLRRGAGAALREPGRAGDHGRQALSGDLRNLPGRSRPPARPSLGPAPRALHRRRPAHRRARGQCAGLDILFVASGIHGGETVGPGGLDAAAVADLLRQEGLDATWAMADLVW